MTNPTESVPEWTVENAIPPQIKNQINSAQTAGDSTMLFISFLNILKSLKTTRRTGWLNLNVDNAESIADHMYRMGIIAMMTNESTIDTGRATKIALVHDMAEALVGDITPEDPVPKEEKHRREASTMDYLKDLIAPFNPKAAQEIHELWYEYENLTSKEARFVKDVDKFELIVQTFEEERRYNGTKDLSRFISVRSQIKTPEVCKWADDVMAQRDQFWAHINKKTKS